MMRRLHNVHWPTMAAIVGASNGVVDLYDKLRKKKVIRKPEGKFMRDIERKSNPARFYDEGLNEFGLPVVYFSIDEESEVFIQANRTPEGWVIQTLTREGMPYAYDVSEETERAVNAYINGLEAVSPSMSNPLDSPFFTKQLLQRLSKEGVVTTADDSLFARIAYSDPERFQVRNDGEFSERVVITLRPNVNPFARRRPNAYKRTPQTPLHVHGYERESAGGTEHDVDPYWRGKRGKGAHPRIAPTPRANPHVIGTHGYLDLVGANFNGNVYAYHSNDGMRGGLFIPSLDGVSYNIVSDDWHAPPNEVELTEALAIITADKHGLEPNPKRGKRSPFAPRHAFLHNPNGDTQRLEWLVTDAENDLERTVDAYPGARATPRELKAWEKAVAKARTKQQKLLSNLQRARVKAAKKLINSSQAKPAAIDRLSRMFHGEANKNMGRTETHFVSSKLNAEHFSRLGALPYIKPLQRPPGAEQGHDALDHACDVCAIMFKNPAHAKLGMTTGRKLGLMGREVWSVGKRLRRNMEQQDPSLIGREIDLGKIEVTGYLTEEKHSPSGEMILYYHPAAEESGRVDEMPNLILDVEGMPYIPVRGYGSGNYTVDERGIIN